MKFVKLLMPLIVFCIATPSLASDHIDGKVTTSHGVADISDFYAFWSPQNNGALSLVLNMYPMVGGDGHFSEKVKYEFIIGDLKLDTEKRNFNPIKTKTISCELTEMHGRHHGEYSVQCGVEGLDLKAAADWQSVSNFNGFRAYLGKHSDPFFMNQKWVTDLVSKGKLGDSDGSNVMDQLNVLSIVIEVDTNKLFTTKPAWLGLAARSVSSKKDPIPGRQLDWIGRPEITNFSLWADADTDIRDEFNKQMPFAIDKNMRAKVKSTLKDHIENHYDAADGQYQWRNKNADHLVDLLANDYLVISTDTNCRKTQFLDIEFDLITFGETRGCGGRDLNDDIVDRMLSLYVTGLPEGLSDGVNRPYRATSSSFPYLAEPDLSFSAKAKAWIARQILK